MSLNLDMLYSAGQSAISRIDQKFTNMKSAYVKLIQSALCYDTMMKEIANIRNLKDRQILITQIVIKTAIEKQSCAEFAKSQVRLFARPETLIGTFANVCDVAMRQEQLAFQAAQAAHLAVTTRDTILSQLSHSEAENGIEAAKIRDLVQTLFNEVLQLNQLIASDFVEIDQIQNKIYKKRFQLQNSNLDRFKSIWDQSNAARWVVQETMNNASIALSTVSSRS